METERIELRRERDFGQVFNAAFGFIKQEIKPLGQSLLMIVFPGVIIQALLVAYLYGSMRGIGGYPTYANNFGMVGKFFGIIGIIVLLSIFVQSILTSTVISYVKIYLHKKESPNVREVFPEALRHIFPVIGAFLLGSIVIAIGFICCILPGIYLAVSLSLLFIALIIEKNGIGNAFSRSFQLTHMQWWLTFLIILVSGIIVYVFYIILQIPAYIMGINSLFLNLKQYSGTNATPILSNAYIIYQSVDIIISQFIYPIPLLILTFHYFNLAEIREKPSLIDKIETIGT